MARDPRYPNRDFDLALIEVNRNTLTATTDTLEQENNFNTINVLVPDRGVALTMSQIEAESEVILKVAPERLSDYKKMCSEYDRGTSILVLIVHEDDNSVGIYHIKRVPRAVAKANPYTPRILTRTADEAEKLCSVLRGGTRGLCYTKCLFNKVGSGRKSGYIDIQEELVYKSIEEIESLNPSHFKEQALNALREFLRLPLTRYSKQIYTEWD